MDACLQVLGNFIPGGLGPSDDFSDRLWVRLNAGIQQHNQNNNKHGEWILCVSVVGIDIVLIVYN